MSRINDIRIFVKRAAGYLTADELDLLNNGLFSSTGDEEADDSELERTFAAMASIKGISKFSTFIICLTKYRPVQVHASTHSDLWAHIYTNVHTHPGMNIAYTNFFMIVY